MKYEYHNHAASLCTPTPRPNTRRPFAIIREGCAIMTVALVAAVVFMSAICAVLALFR
jgi:hypothetical protein